MWWGREGNSGADTITVTGTQCSFAAGGKGNDTISLGAVDGGQVGGQLGADTIVRALSSTMRW